MRSLLAEIDQELEYCLFYDEYQNRKASTPNLGEWVFTKQEDIEPEYSWREVPGEQWTKTNGRIKATIQLDRTSLMVKITLEYKNDSNHLKFYEAPYREKPSVTHLKSENSISDKIQELKNEADAFLMANLSPHYSQYDLLNQLLCLNGGKQ